MQAHIHTLCFSALCFARTCVCVCVCALYTIALENPTNTRIFHWFLAANKSKSLFEIALNCILRSINTLLVNSELINQRWNGYKSLDFSHTFSTRLFVQNFLQISENVRLHVAWVKYDCVGRMSQNQWNFESRNLQIHYERTNSNGQEAMLHTTKNK